jgi:PAS domain S-box-containing protein
MSENKRDLLLEEIINLIPYHIFWKDKDLNYLGANEAFAKAAGFKSANDIIGKCDYDGCWTKEESDFFRKMDQEVIDSKTPRLNIDESQKQLDGTTKILLTSKVLLTNIENEVIGILGIYTDRSDRKHIEVEKDPALDELDKIQNKLIQNETLRALGLMAGGIAHEINNPLAVISGKANIIKKLVSRENIDVDIVTKHCDDLIRTVYRCTDVIQNLKDFSRQKPEDCINQFLLGESLKSIIDLVALKTTYNSKVEIIQRYSEMTVSAKKISFEQSLINLIENAIFELKDEKVISIYIDNYDGVKSGVRVSNPGAPIPKDILNNMFDPFFTTKPIGEGTGLGLSTCKSLMKSCGGDIFYERHNDMNSFVITFAV